MKFYNDLKPLTNLELLELVDTLKIKNFREVFMRDTLPPLIKEREVGIVYLDSSEGKGTYWVCYYSFSPGPVPTTLSLPLLYMS